MADNRPGKDMVPGKDSKPTDYNPVERGKEFLPDPWHWFVCSLKKKRYYLLISALAFVTVNVNSAHNLIQFKDLNIFILGVSYCTKFDHGSDILPIPFTVMQICHDEDTLREQSFCLTVFITLFLIILFKCYDYAIPSNLWEDVYIAECSFSK